VDRAVAAASPGQHEIHYAPRAPAYRFAPNQRELLERISSDAAMSACALILLGSPENRPPPVEEKRFANIHYLPADPGQFASGLYALLRAVDTPAVTSIFVEMPPDEPKWAAVRDRLQRATRVNDGLLRRLQIQAD